ncbi:MAG: hypothetical protein M1831_004439 [Alyxoria varia]|nr:MAG: hypothetical protein M1831_004439 [Alyxoria varia]
MTSLLRRIVAGPRAQHPEANLDLCYVTDNIIATSGPSLTYPSLAYRNPLSALVTFLDSKHGPNWTIWEFRAEGTGYPDIEVYNRINHFPWPDHHPPPFKLVPEIMGTMRDWLRGEEGLEARKRDGVQVARGAEGENGEERGMVVVVHCKAGKGRSGSMAVSYLVSEEGWTREAALQRFTERRMRPGFGAGISIPSQLRWLGYVERWAACGKKFVEQRVEVVEVHLWGLRDGVKLELRGFVEDGKKIKTLHTFNRSERDDIDTDDEKGDKDVIGRAESMKLTDMAWELMRRKKNGSKPSSRSNSPAPRSATGTGTATSSSVLPSSDTRSAPVDDHLDSREDDPATPASDAAASANPVAATPEDDANTPKTNTIFRPSSPIPFSTSDINFAAERRAHTTYGWTMVTSLAHVWFNCFFEGNGPENMRAGQGRRRSFRKWARTRSKHSKERKKKQREHGAGNGGDVQTPATAPASVNLSSLGSTPNRDSLNTPRPTSPSPSSVSAASSSAQSSTTSYPASSTSNPPQPTSSTNASTNVSNTLQTSVQPHATAEALSLAADKAQTKHTDLPKIHSPRPAHLTADNIIDEDKKKNLHHGPDPSGVFTISWEAMDGLKGSSRKGVRAFDKVDIVWRVVGVASADGDEGKDNAAGIGRGTGKASASDTALEEIKSAPADISINVPSLPGVGKETAPQTAKRGNVAEGKQKPEPPAPASPPRRIRHPSLEGESKKQVTQGESDTTIAEDETEVAEGGDSEDEDGAEGVRRGLVGDAPV